jgi:hypothetical protein
VFLRGALEFTPPCRGDQRRGVMRLSDALTTTRANVWRMPPESRGRRHRELVQEDLFVVLQPGLIPSRSECQASATSSRSLVWYS